MYGKPLALLLLTASPALATPDLAKPALAAPVVHDGLSPPVRAWKAAMEAGDVAALARMHDGATIAYPPNAVEVRGGVSILKGYVETFATDTVRVTVDDAHWVEQGPLVVSWGRTTLTFHPKAGGKDVVSHSRFTDAAVATDGGWRYLVDHASVVN